MDAGCVRRSVYEHRCRALRSTRIVRNSQWRQFLHGWMHPICNYDCYIVSCSLFSLNYNININESIRCNVVLTTSTLPPTTRVDCRMHKFSKLKQHDFLFIQRSCFTFIFLFMYVGIKFFFEQNPFSLSQYLISMKKSAQRNTSQRARVQSVRIDCDTRTSCNDFFFITLDLIFLTIRIKMQEINVQRERNPDESSQSMQVYVRIFSKKYILCNQILNTFSSR